MFRFQLNFLTVCFVILPWSIVVICWIQLRNSPRFPVASQVDLIEIQRLSDAIRRYKAQYGEYPPDFTSTNPQQEIDLHLAKIFPSRDRAIDVPILTGNLGPQNALSFWLSGFSKDTRFPLTGSGRRQRALFNFENRRLLLGNLYVPRSSKLPYVYFRSQSYSKASFAPANRRSGVARPYYSSSGGNSKSFIDGFQIIAAGADNHFGDADIPVEDAHLSLQHSDNLTSFCRNAIGKEGVTQERTKRRRNLVASIPVAVVCFFLNLIFRGLRSRVSGLNELRRVISCEYALASPSWAQTLLEQRKSDRDRAINRLVKRNQTSE